MEKISEIISDVCNTDSVHKRGYCLALCCEMWCLFSIREADKDFQNMPFQAHEVVLYGVQPQTLKSNIELTAMSFRLVISTTFIVI